jgi:nucleotide-binding universal stress UspA family protein
MFDSIVVPLDLTQESDRVLPVVNTLATGRSLGVHLVTTISTGLDATVDGVDMDSRAARITGGADCHVLPTEDEVSAIAEFADGYQAGLVCLASHARSVVGELLFGSMTDALLHHHHGPMLVVGPHVDVEAFAPGCVVVCVGADTPDGPVPALLDAATAWQQTFGGELVVFETVDDLVDLPNTVITPELSEAAEALPGAAVVSEPAMDPARAIVDRSADPGVVIALAAHGIKGVRRALHGSVSWEVLRRSLAPVLLVPAFNV